MKEILLTSSVLILALLLLRRLFRKAVSRRVQYALWGLVLLRLLVPVSLPGADFSLLTAAQPVQEEVSERLEARQIYVLPMERAPLSSYTVPDGAALEPGAPLPAWRDPDTSAAPEGTSPTLSEPTTPKPQWSAGAATGTSDSSFGYAVLDRDGETVTRYADRISLNQLLGFFWKLGIVLMAGWLVLTNLHFWYRLYTTRTPFPVEGCKRPVYLCEGLASPCLFGLLRPAIYLNPAAASSPEALRHVLAHEETHARHLDPLWSLLRGVCLAVYWFDPLVWWAAFASRTDCELACDEGTLRRLGEEERLAYGRTILSLIPVRETPQNPMLSATTMAAGKKQLTDRITRIAKQNRTAATALAAVAVLAALVCAVTFTGAVGRDAPDPSDGEPQMSDSDLYWLDYINTKVFNGTDQFGGLYKPTSGNPKYIWSADPITKEDVFYNIRHQFLTSYYDSPEDIDLDRLLRIGIPGALCIDSRVRDGLYTPLVYSIDEFLQEYTGLTLEETNGVGLEYLTYHEEGDYHGTLEPYYSYLLDESSYIPEVTFDYIEREDKLYRVYYTVDSGDENIVNRRACVTLRQMPGLEWHFVSHQLVDELPQRTWSWGSLGDEIGAYTDGWAAEEDSRLWSWGTIWSWAEQQGFDYTLGEEDEAARAVVLAELERMAGEPWVIALTADSVECNAYYTYQSWKKYFSAESTVFADWTAERMRSGLMAVYAKYHCEHDAAQTDQPDGSFEEVFVLVRGENGWEIWDRFTVDQIVAADRTQVPQAVRAAAELFIQEKVQWWTDSGDEVDGWRITSLYGPILMEDWLWNIPYWPTLEISEIDLEIWRLGYELHTPTPERFGDMRLNEDGSGYLGYPDCDYLIFRREADGSLTYLFCNMENDCGPGSGVFWLDAIFGLAQEGFLDLTALSGETLLNLTTHYNTRDSFLNGLSYYLTDEEANAVIRTMVDCALQGSYLAESKLVGMIQSVRVFGDDWFTGSGWRMWNKIAYAVMADRFRSILRGEYSFWSASDVRYFSNIGDLDELAEDLPQVTVTEFTLSDLDRDGVPELVLRLTDSAGRPWGDAVLRWEGVYDYGPDPGVDADFAITLDPYMSIRNSEAVKAYYIPNGGLVDLKTDGTHAWTGAVANPGFGQLLFINGECARAATAYDLPGGDPEYRRAKAEQDAKPDAVWYTLTEENIAAVDALDSFSDIYTLRAGVTTRLDDRDWTIYVTNVYQREHTQSSDGWLETICCCPGAQLWITDVQTDGGEFNWKYVVRLKSGEAVPLEEVTGPLLVEDVADIYRLEGEHNLAGIEYRFRTVDGF